TLFAASARYGYVPAARALGLAFCIAALGVALAAAWWSETLACFAVLGAILAPAVVETRLTPLGSLFVGVLYAAAAALFARRGWWALSYAAALAIGAE